MKELLRQPRLTPRSVGRELLELLFVSEGWLDGLAPRVAAAVVARAAERAHDHIAALDEAKPIEPVWADRLGAVVHACREERPG